LKIEKYLGFCGFEIIKEKTKQYELLTYGGAWQRNIDFTN